MFAERGFDGASLRAIASTAGVDPALIRHFFGDKATLFATAITDRITFPQALGASLAGDPSTAGRRLTDAYLRHWEQPETRPSLLALVRSAMTSERAATMLQDFLSAQLSDFAHENDLPDDRLQGIALAGAHLVGIAIARHVMKIQPLANLDYDDLVGRVAPTIQRYLTGLHTD